MKTKGQWQEYRAYYARTIPHHEAERGELTFKARNDSQARAKAIHLLRARGIRYKFTLAIERAANKERK